jgi:preprotein translocase subunit SecD
MGRALGVATIFVACIACARLTSQRATVPPATGPLVAFRLAHQVSAPGRERVEADGRTFYLDRNLAVTEADFRYVEAFVRGDTLYLDHYFTGAGSERMRKVTSENIGKYIAVIIDGRVRSAPVIQSSIGGPHMLGGATIPSAEAERIAEKIRVRWPSP